MAVRTSEPNGPAARAFPENGRFLIERLCGCTERAVPSGQKDKIMKGRIMSILLIVLAAL